MKPSIGLVCTGMTSQVLRRIINNIQLDANFIWTNKLLTNETRFPQELEEADVLLSSGYLSRILQRISIKPVIEIHPNAFDILMAYSLAIRYDPFPAIILPIIQTEQQHLEQLKEELTGKIYIDFYDSIEEIIPKIQAYKTMGHRCIIGSGLTCNLAESMSMKSIFVYSEKSLQKFILLAYEKALLITKERETNQHILEILRHSNEGIVLTDDHGNILLYNEQASSVLKVDANQLNGLNIRRLFPDSVFQKTAIESRSVQNIILRHEGEQYRVTFNPIAHKGDKYKVIVLINKLSSSQILRSSNFAVSQKKINSKGFVARHHFENYSTRSPIYHNVIKKAKAFARCDESIIIYGETGVGKEVIAQSIHNYSHRAHEPFVAVNCSAISENLLESELFGYDDGAFTGARKGGKLGYFELANHGTIFLDEIGELSQALQSKLLRVLQERQLIHVGGDKVINLDVRIVAATNRNLWDLIQQKKFREDLYYRLAALELEIPPLRSRREDIFAIFHKLLEEQDLNLATLAQKNCVGIDQILCSYSWPGNIRELENFTKTVMATYNSDFSGVFIDLLKHEIQRRQHRIKGEKFPEPVASHLKLKECEYQQIQTALIEAGGNYTKAAALLGISRVTLWRKLRAQASEDTFNICSQK